MDYEHQIEENIDCPICLDVIDDKLIRLVGCNHTFHHSCINTWYLKSNTCPLCRKNIKDMFRVSFKMYVNPFYSPMKNYIIELKENKLVFYKLLTYKNANSNPYRNTSFTDSPNINNLCNLTNKEAIGEIYLTILFQDISIVNYNLNYLIFQKLSMPKNKTNFQNVAIQYPKKYFKIKFKTCQDAYRCFEIIKLRNEYFREFNY